MSKYTCPVCGNQHDELPTYSFDAPAPWSAADEDERKHFELGSELCRYRDDQFFIRAMLWIPVLGQPDEPLEFATWAVVSKDNWWKYRSIYMEFNAASLPIFYGWIGNGIPGYEDTYSLKVQIRPRGQALRPELTVIEAPQHPLQIDQSRGIPLDQAMRYLHEHGGF